MSLIKIESPSDKDVGFALFNLGFRPFFLCAGLFAVLSIFVWFLVYSLHIQLPPSSINPFQWHAHEMIYGYGLAVITGFLLTAVQNWTGLQTLCGKPLFALVVLWIAARVLLFSGLVLAAAFVEMSFFIVLCVVITYPIVRAKQWRQMAVVSKLIALFIANALFYLGVFGVVDKGTYWGIYGGLYLMVGLIMMMGRRVVPFFIEKGVGYPVELRNSRLIDLSSLALFLVFFIAELMQSATLISAYSALLLFILNSIRLCFWHTHGLWKKPLLWGIYLAMWFISLGFLLHFLAYAVGVSKFIAIHAFSYGGIGLITIGMMARVSLGHTGRSIHDLPAGIRLAFGGLLLGAVFRVGFCLLLPNYYLIWVGISQILWMLAFLIFTFKYFPILTKGRVDGQFG